MISLLSQHIRNPTPDLATSIGHVGSDMETPSTWYEEGLGFEITVLSDIPEFDNFAGDLSYLDQDDDTPIGELRFSIPIVLVNSIFNAFSNVKFYDFVDIEVCVSYAKAGFRGTPEVGMPEFETLPIRIKIIFVKLV